MKKLIYSVVALAVISLSVSCSKTPTASFTTDKSSYIAGETVHLTNSSTKGSTFLWTMPDGQTSASENVDYTIGTNTPTGTLNFKLDVTATTYGKKKANTSQSVNVTAATGKATFWYNSNGTMATVVVDGQTGFINAYYPTYNPDCTSTGCATFTLNVGTHSYTASSSFSNWSGTVDVTYNGCSLVLLN